jgi:hypothetical protein
LLICLYYTRGGINIRCVGKILRRNMKSRNAARNEKTCYLKTMRETVNNRETKRKTSTKHTRRERKFSALFFEEPQDRAHN